MLQAKHLSFSVTEEGKTRKIIDDVSFDVAEGEMLVITGPNGSGKSTLLKAILGQRLQRLSGGVEIII